MASDEIIKTVTAISGQTYEYVWTPKPYTGATKDVYFSPDKTYAVAFFKEPLNPQSIERLENLVGKYRQQVFDGNVDYWKNIFCWPTDLIREGDQVGLIVPAFRPEFFFQYNGPILDLKGEDKKGKWFTSPEHHFRYLDPKEIGDWRSYLNICLLLARGVRRLHLAGLVHSDLSYNNVLIDPVSSSATIIGIDGIVLPGDSPEVYGTPDFIAPELYEDMALPKSDPNKKLPCQETDLHALAVLIYMLLLHRHPLRGKLICDAEDPTKDENLSMGSKAVFIEDPRNNVNRYDVNWVQQEFPKSKWSYIFPWMDLNKLPYTILGPHLKALFDRAFVEGLHYPSARPKALEWEEALIQTMDLLIPCQNPNCNQKWFVYDNSASKPKCPFCGHSYDIPLPVLNLYCKGKDCYKPTGSRVLVYNGVQLFPWHSDPTIAFNEKLTDEQKKPLATFQFDQGKWLLRNENSAGMMNLSNKKTIEVGSAVELCDNLQIRLGDENSRMIYVQMVNK